MSIRSILKITGRVPSLQQVREPFFLLRSLRDVDSLDFEDNRAGPVITAGDHHAVVVGPALHDGTALKSCVNIAADRIPGFPAEFAFIR